VDEIRGVGRPKKAKTALFFEPAYISELLLDSSDDSDDDNEADAAVPKTSTTEKVAVPKTSKKRGPRGPYKKKQQ
jgi:hypothetical protein